MKQRTLLLIVMASFITVTHAQKKQQPVTGYAITAMEKGGRSWKEVRLVDISSGEQLKSIYQSTQDVEALNARTGKPVEKKSSQAMSKVPIKKVVNLDMELDKAGTTRIYSYTTDDKITTKIEKVNVNTNVNVDEKKIREAIQNKTITIIRSSNMPVQTDKPFATNSAAMAYDKKHDRLYYTPMGINQLRYIDLRSSKIYFFENEPFGVVAGMHDGANQITRMVIASDGNGYALSNDGKHLIRFTTGRKPEITDLGSLTDDAANGNFSVHSRGGYGGDLIADNAKNVYLITANRNVFKISLESKVATYKGAIKGLPKGFSTNGAMVEEGTKVIIASSESTVGYYRFDLNTLEAEKVSTSPNVFNASDLANGNLAFEKKKKEKKQKDQPEVKEEVKDVVVAEDPAAKQTPATEDMPGKNGISVYPNPVTNGLVKLSFTDQPAGKYQVQFLDIAGRTISTQEVNINNKVQIVDFRIPDVAKGSYLVKVISEANKVSVTNQLVVQ